MPKKSTSSTLSGAKIAREKAPASAQRKGASKALPTPQNTFQNLVIITDFGDDVANAQIEMRYRNVAQWVQEECTKRVLMPSDIKLPKAQPLPKPSVINITDVPFGNIDYAGYALYCCYRALGRSRPNLFIHACDPKASIKEDRGILQTDYGNTFIGPNNGTLGLLKTYFEDRGIQTKLWQLNPEKLEELEQHRMEEPTYHIPNTFQGRDIFAVAAGLIAGGVPVSSFAELKDETHLVSTNFAQKLKSLPLKLDTEVQCFAFKDNTNGNLKTNLMLDDLTFDQLVEEDAVFQVSPVQNNRLWPTRVIFSAKRMFTDVSQGQGVMYLGSTFAPEWDSRLIELALNMGNATQKLGLLHAENTVHSGAMPLKLRRLR